MLEHIWCIPLVTMNFMSLMLSVKLQMSFSTYTCIYIWINMLALSRTWIPIPFCTLWCNVFILHFRSKLIRLKSVIFLLHRHIKNKQNHITTYLMTWKREVQAATSPVLEKWLSVSNFTAELTQRNTKWKNKAEKQLFKIESESSFAIYFHVLLSINGQYF